MFLKLVVLVSPKPEPLTYTSSSGAFPSKPTPYASKLSVYIVFFKKSNEPVGVNKIAFVSFVTLPLTTTESTIFCEL